jgi:hypothetical protein
MDIDNEFAHPREEPFMKVFWGIVKILIVILAIVGVFLIIQIGSCLHGMGAFNG